MTYTHSIYLYFKMCFIHGLHQDTAKQHIAATLLLYLLSCSITKGNFYNDIIVIIIISLKYLLAVIDLVPAEVVHVCPGGQLNLTCKTNESYMEWNVTLSQYQRLSRHILSRSGISQSIVQIWIDESNIFNISGVIDESLALPLVSVMFSDNVTASINGTLISCTEVYNLNLNSDIWIKNTLTTRLHIIERRAPNYCRF